MRLGLLGGSFDPPHLGHLVVAEVARVSLLLDEVRFVVAGDPWMKATAASAAHRVAMTALAVDGHPDFRVDDRETSRPGPTYTVDTLEELREDHPDAELVFIVGADQVEVLPEWRDIDRCMELARFIVAPRPGYDGGDASDIESLAAPALELSSSDLRERFRRDAAVRYQVPRSVERYVKEHTLYRPSHDG